MPKSLVRVNLKARNPNSQAYDEAVKEFIEKMGGKEQVLAKMREMQGSENTLFNNIASRGYIIKSWTHPDLEDPGLSM